MSIVDAAINTAFVLQIAATVFFCLFGMYCYLMVGVHAWHRKTMLARDEEVWRTWRPTDAELPFVTIQLPLHNEENVVARLIETIVGLDYPKDRMEIQILDDDSTDGTTEIARDLTDRYKSAGFDIALLRRTVRTGYKAGALAEGHKVARGEFIAIFDADFVPRADFLRVTLPFFQDPKVALVQTLWGHLNANYSSMTIAQALGLDGINYVLQSAQCWAGLMMHFQGTAGVWRKVAIDDAGGWQSDTLTEDLDLSYRSQIRGWKQKYLPQVISPGELPATVAAAKTQQHRWAKGGFQVMCKLLPDILRSRLPTLAKVEAAFYMVSMIFQPCMLVMAISWPLQIWVRKDLSFSSDLLPVAAFLFVCSLGPMNLYFYTLRHLYADWPKRLHHYLHLMFWSMGLAVTNARAILEVALGIKTGFIRTPKFNIASKADLVKRAAYRSKVSGQVFIEAFIALYCLGGIAFMVSWTRPIVDPFLVIFTIGMCLVAGHALWEPIAERRAVARALAPR